VEGHLFQGFGAVEVLTAGDKPNFKLFQIKHKSSSFQVPYGRVAKKTTTKAVVPFR
jgi:hypothetical protein